MAETIRRGAVLAAIALALVACGGGESGQGGGATTSASETTTSGASVDNESDAEHDDDHDEDADHDDESESSSGLGAHEHGAAELSVAWADGEVVVDLISPTHNIFGFEHEPSDDEDRSVVEDRTNALAQSEMIAVNAEAGCSLKDEVSTEVEFEGSHAELTASWVFDCENTDDIGELDLAAMFAEFPNLEDVDVEWASDSGQGAAELSPSATVVSFG